MLIDNPTIFMLFSLLIIGLFTLIYQTRSCTDTRHSLKSAEEAASSSLNLLSSERSRRHKLAEELEQCMRRLDTCIEINQEMKDRIRGLEQANAELQQEIDGGSNNHDKWRQLLGEALEQWPKNWRWVAQDIDGACNFHKNKPKYSITENGFISKDKAAVESSISVRLPNPILDRAEAEQLYASLGDLP